MMDEEKSFHATREGFARLSDLEWAAVGRMDRGTANELYRGRHWRYRNVGVS